MRCRIVLDGGAYASASPAVVGNAASLSAGPYVIDDVDIEALALYTNNPPCGAMRGFGVVQVCFGHEAQMASGAEEMAGTSVVSTTYGTMDTVYGGMGVLGPTRMDYPGTIASVAAVALYIGEVLGAR